MSSKKFRVKVLYPDFIHKCNHCEYETKSKRAIGLHFRVSHGIDKKLSDLSSSEKFCDKVVCGTCRKWFYDKNSLEHHKMVCRHY